MNQTGSRIVSAHLPRFGLATSMMPHITLKIPEISDSIGPKPVKRDRRVYTTMSSMPITITITP